MAALSEALRVSEAEAAHLSCVEVTRAAVAAAMKRAKPGTSPGPDGLPLEVYRRFKPIFLPLLARVFQAIIRDVLLPPGFQDGVLIFLPKPGEADASNPAGFRPITLLNTDYRLFARLLASRLGSALTQIIDSQQTAFLAKRGIGENIMLMQMLPHALKAQGRSAVAVFCDFRKAYDTVDRTFLWKVMARLGVGGRLPARHRGAAQQHARARLCEWRNVTGSGFPGWRTAGVPPSAPAVPIPGPGLGQNPGLDRQWNILGGGVALVHARRNGIPARRGLSASVPGSHGRVWRSHRSTPEPG